MGRGQFLRAAQLGTGVMLIQRQALERLREAYPELWVDGVPDRISTRYPGMRTGVLQVFNQMISPRDGLPMGEDISFSQRWTDIGGELWACFTERVSHFGQEMFWGDYGARLAAQGHIPPRT